MIFRQFFDPVSHTYSYLIARRAGGEAVIIDPVLDHVADYLSILEALELKLVKAIDTHLHADHVTALGALSDRTDCLTVMGTETAAEMVAVRLRDGERLDIDGVAMTALHTPGHTPDSYCFHLQDRVITGDTLLIGGTGRTDFQGGDPAAQYESLFGRLLALDDRTLVFPGHDYRGRSFSTIAEEKASNPRLRVTSVAQYVDIMNTLDLPSPKLMDIAVPANLRLGRPAVSGLAS